MHIKIVSHFHLFQSPGHRRKTPVVRCLWRLPPSNSRERTGSHRSNDTGISHLPYDRDKCQGHLS